MLRKILILSCLALPLVALSQKNKKNLPVASSKAADSTDYRQMGAPMPPLRVVPLKGSIITQKSLPANQKVVLMMFNPTCEHCEDMTQAIEQNIFLFKKTSILMVAGAMMQPYLPEFQTRFKTAQYPSLKIGVDSSKIIDHLFNYLSLPQLNIYDKNHKLIKVLSGITTIDSLKAYID